MDKVDNLVLKMKPIKNNNKNKINNKINNEIRTSRINKRNIIDDLN